MSILLTGLRTGYSPLPSDPWRGNPRPALRARSHYVAGAALLLQLLVLPLVALAGNPLWLVGASLALVLGVASFRWQGRGLAHWTFVLWFWLGRRRNLRRAAKSEQQSDALGILNPRIQLGAVAGPQSSEIGLVHEATGWATTLWVTDGPYAAEQPVDEQHEETDGLTRMLSLPVPQSKSVHLQALLQQSSAGGAEGQMTVTAWLTLHADPLRTLSPKDAVGAVPALLRNEVRRLMNSTRDGRLTLVSLDRGDLLGALSASAELPVVAEGIGGSTPDVPSEPPRETWRQWHAHGRWHESFAVAPAAGDFTALIGLLLNGAGRARGTTVTVAVRYGIRSGWLAQFPLTVRVSHSQTQATAAIAAELQKFARERGAKCRAMDGLAGPAALSTSVLARSITA